jgi:hypothetical protein
VIGWIDKPLHPPFRCALTLASTAAQGPYYATGFSYFRAVASEQGPRPGHTLEQLYLSAGAFAEALGAPSSPLVVTVRADYERDAFAAAALLAERNDLITERDALRARVAELEGLADPDSLADAVAARLEDRFARKPGPKPKVPA